MPLHRGSAIGRSIIDRQTIHIQDLAVEAEDEFPVGVALARRFGYHTVLATPLLRKGVPIGAIVIRRLEVRSFTERQIRLLETFADQAVIAIDNARLIHEQEARNRDLTEALEQQTATSEILRVIASSPTIFNQCWTLSRKMQRAFVAPTMRHSDLSKGTCSGG